MLSAITLGLSALQLAMAIAVLVLSISIAGKATHYTKGAVYHRRITGPLTDTLRFCIFLGAYGISSALVTIASLFVTAVSALVPLLLQASGALMFLAGAVALALELGKFAVSSCGAAADALVLMGYSSSFAENTGRSCRRCAADEGLLFALVPLSLGLAACAFLRRRGLRQSAEDW